MSNVITKRIAEYDREAFIKWHIDYYLNNIDEFQERYEFYKIEINHKDVFVGNVKPERITEEVIEDILWRDEFMDGDAWETFEHDMGYFNKYSGETFSVIGTNMGWQNRTGQKDVEVTDGMDLFEAIQVNTDFSVRFWSESDAEPGVYWANLHHHDSPMGETYEFTLKQ